MQDTDFKTWALIIALAVGGTFQIAKSFKPSPLRQTADVSASFNEADDEPYSVSRDEEDRPSPPAHAAPAPRANVEVSSDQMAKFLAQAQPTQSGTFADKDKGDEAKKKDDLKCVKKTDPKTGKEKEVCKKKKKKKKAADPAAETPKSTAPAKSHGDTSDSAAIQWGVANVVATNQLNTNNGQPDTAFESLQYWEKILLDKPDLDETKRFIDHFQRNLVTADVYYQITKEMMADSRADMKLLGVMCASQSPSLSSFQLLADLTQTETSGSAVRTQADAALARYTDISSLNVLAGVMRANQSTYSVTLAVQKLSVAANRYLTTASATSSTPDQTPKPATTAAAKNKTYFTKFVAILQTLAKSPDATLKSTAAGTLNNLQTLLNQTGGTPTTTPPTAVAQS